MTAVYRIGAMALLTMSICSCASSRQGSREPRPETVLRVDNQSSSDMDIYALRQASTRVRLGIATAHVKTNLRIPDYLLFNVTPLRFLADPIGGRQSPVSEEILVTPGDTVVLTIPPGAS